MKLLSVWEKTFMVIFSSLLVFALAAGCGSKDKEEENGGDGDGNGNGGGAATTEEDCKEKGADYQWTGTECKPNEDGTTPAAPEIKVDGSNLVFTSPDITGTTEASVDYTVTTDAKDSADPKPIEIKGGKADKEAGKVTLSGVSNLKVGLEKVLKAEGFDKAATKVTFAAGGDEKAELSGANLHGFAKAVGVDEAELAKFGSETPSSAEAVFAVFKALFDGLE